MRRCWGQAFFDKCLSVSNRMAASSCEPPENEKAAALIIKTAAVKYHVGIENQPAQQRFFLFCRWADVY